MFGNVHNVLGQAAKSQVHLENMQHLQNPTCLSMHPCYLESLEDT